MRVDRVELALCMVGRRALRSSLAALGLGASLAASIVAVAIADNGRRAALAEIRSIGSNILTVSAEDSRTRGGRERTKNVVTTLTLLDARAIEQQVAHILLVSAEYRSVIPIKAGALARQAAVSASEPAYGRLRNAPLREGRFFDELDDADGNRVAVLGGRLATALFGVEEPVGAMVRLRGVAFAVIGVLNERGTGLDAFDEDEVVFVPLRTARRLLFPVTYVHRLFVRVSEAADIAATAKAVSAVMTERHHATFAERPDFRVQDQQRLVTLRRVAVSRLGTFRFEVTAALLFAGAFGIFALQLLSVRERRAEIGTRRAIGATRRMIFAQFLLEAVVIGVCGCIVGLALGAAATSLQRVALSYVSSGVCAAACCVATVAASVWPAMTAARVHPATALRG